MTKRAKFSFGGVALLLVGLLFLIFLLPDDLCLINLRLGGMDGVETARKIR